MTYRPVVDRFATSVPLDPLSAVLFVAAFIAAALLTVRRPIYGVCALAIVIPFAYAHEIAGTTVTLPKVVLLGVLLGLSTYAGSARQLCKPPAPLLLGTLAAVVIVTAATLLDAAHRGPVIRETFKTIGYALTFGAAFLCYTLDGSVGKRRESADAWLVGTVAVAAIAVAFSALVQEIVGAPSGLYIGAAIVPRIAGVLEGPNQLAGYCTIAAAVLGAWAVARRDTLIDVALAAIVCADILTFSRAGWIGLAIVAAIVALAAGRRAVKALPPALFGLLAGSAGALWWAIYAHTPGVLRASLEPSLYSGGVGNRGELWRAAWRMWLSHPLLGVGAGNFELDLPFYGLAGVRTHANSWYLQSLAEGGLLLFGATVASLVAIVAALGGRNPLRRLGVASPWLVAALAATVALALHQIVDDLVFYPKIGDSWWLLIGVAAASIA